ncbi:MarR family winged helix-turn-helix transcriptional regulator [Sphingomonas sp. SUN039]|uniref:MarR family winged helix-turn-helix transcriptional regulator n=1 Tax=Sphingomonas sp. SUN039 TaxID=2937787 RepID=UPI0021644C28|nr:MarR family winged helix-turn-helix transcriptional regulator [Sphingomonas sp. SUN039]UVO55515.1 MarR family winged helix-turn-helix transcriptional regulator [Sphingomonas sp. SUN039]
MPSASVTRIGVTPPHRNDFGVIGSRLGFLLHLADVAHMRVIQDMLGEIGLTATRATALAYIRANPGCGQTELGRALEINRASTMEMVNALALVGAVERRSGRDKRSNALFVTAVGEALFNQFDEISIKVDEGITATLTSDEAQLLARLLCNIRGTAARHNSI